MTRRFIGRTAALLPIFLLIAAGSVRAEGHDGPHPLEIPVVAQYLQPANETAMLEELNAARTHRELRRLTLDPALTAIARAYARQMLRERFIGHVSPGGSTLEHRLSSAGYAYRMAGENLVFSTGDESEAFAHLMASPGHFANIVGRQFTKVGVAAVSASVYGTMYVQEFAE